MTQRRCNAVLFKGTDFIKKKDYFFLCLSFLKRFLRLCVDILCLLCFLPFGIILGFYSD